MSNDLKEIGKIRKALLPIVKLMREEIDADNLERFDAIEKTLSALLEKDYNVTVQAPEVNIPEITIPEPKVTVNVEKSEIDTSEIVRILDDKLSQLQKSEPKKIKDPKVTIDNLQELADTLGKAFPKSDTVFSAKHPYQPSSGQGNTALKLVRSATTGADVLPIANADGTFITGGGSSATYKIKFDTSDAHVTYVGKASVGTATSSNSWFIEKIDNTTSSDGTITYANAGLFTATWDNRLTETYS